ncbi:MAG: transcription elongation factor GreA [Candidatus Omnitrophica bacterium]|nr:transcription elongation factor GreA [Candidatus Omnitrophota bacterium]
MMQEKTVLTREGYEKLVEELHILKTKKRREAADNLEKARAHGDLRENSEYETAKEAKHQLESRIASLERKLSHAKVVDPSEIRTDKAFLGVTLEIKNLNSGDTFRYTLVSQDEADITQGKISVTSPIGKGLLGKAPSETAEIQIPAGKIKLQIIRIIQE